ncbi:efflux RND transporter periplasmic adaptor subunit [uncultured Paraglaciecola sp.]|uniref:efflux RND transporter periplasmic adaptor subunit n=1 Tax=uncultured Paraglaciecola sp. TaxID=1765024 RepID=UPI0025E73808|nr:efflux RND transporter periplasmic adaptor subunit [uncultured Paraglaciecola sp.]
MQQVKQFIHHLAKPSTIILFCSGFLIACSKAPEEQQQVLPRLVKTQLVNAGSGSDWREFPGTVEAAQTAELGFRVSGKLAEIKVKEGDQVKLAQVLAKLDDTDYQIQLRTRQADYDKAAADFKRGKSLLSQKLIAKADFDKLEAQHASSLAALTAANQNVEYTSLKAPFSGSIARRHVDNFEDVSAVQAIFTLQDLASIHIKVNIPETLMILVKTNEKPNVFAIFDAIPDQQFPLTLLEVTTLADSGSKTFAVTFNMPKVDSFNILPGMSVTVRGSRPSSSAINASSVIVPAQAVIETNEGRFAFVVENVHNKQGTVRRKTVTTGHITGQGLEVVSGLQTGERLITAGMSKMSDGMSVRVSEEWSQ